MSAYKTQTTSNVTAIAALQEAATTTPAALTRQAIDEDLLRTIREETKAAAKAEYDATILMFTADFEKNKEECAKRIEANKEECAKRIEALEKDNLDVRCELEIVEFLAYLCGADISPPPPIPSIWHTERSSMRRMIYSTILDYANRQRFSEYNTLV